MNNEPTNNILYELVEVLPDEITIPVICLLVLCGCCCAKDYIICCWRERRANQRLRTLQQIARETVENDSIQNIELSMRSSVKPPKTGVKTSKYKTRDGVGVLV